MDSQNQNAEEQNLTLADANQPQNNITPGPVFSGAIVEGDNSVSLPPIKPIKKSHKTYYILLIILIVAVAIVAAFHISQHANQKNNPTLSPAPITSSFSVGNIIVKYVDMPGLSDYKAGNINSFDESQGHFVYGDAKVVCGGCSEPFWGKGKVVYDGRTVYSGDIDSASVKLSNNGQHYSYVDPSGTNGPNSTYIDNHHLKNSNYMVQEPNIIDAIADNGQDFAYDNSAGLYVTSTLMYFPSPEDRLILPTNGPVAIPVFSSDLSDYITVESITIEASNAESTDSVTEAVIYNSKILTTLAEGSDRDVGISQNGQHYIYSTNDIVDHDGATVTVNNNETVNQVAVANSGAYTYITCNTATNASTVYIGSNSYPDGTCGAENIRLVPVKFNDDASHYFYFYNDQPSDRAVLDGKQLTLSGEISGADFSGNTLYVYRWVN